MEQKVQTLIDAASASTCSNDLLMVAIAAKNVSSNVSSFIDTIANIPDLYTTPMVDGTIIFVAQLNTYLISNGYIWYSLDGREYRYDGPTTSVWGWGYNNYGGLGDNSTVNKSSPVSVVGGFTDWCQVSASNRHSVGLRANGTAWSWGNNGGFELGDSTFINKSSPVSVSGGFTDWCRLSTGGASSIGLRTNGTLWSWGNNNGGKLGDLSVCGRSSPVPVAGGLNDWVYVDMSADHTTAIRSNGTLWAWGLGAYGKLGDNSIVAKSSPVSVVGGFTDWCQVSAGALHNVALRCNGTMWSWGRNNAGQLGDNSITDKSSPVSVAGGFTDWCQVSAGWDITVAIRTNGSAWTWGWNINGELGNNSTVSTSSPVSVVGGFTDWCQASAGTSHITAVKTNGTVWSWGYNCSGGLGNNSTIATSSPVSVIGGFTDWCQVIAGGYHTLAIRATP